MSTQQPLASRDVNTTSPTKPKSSKPLDLDAADKPKSMEYHRQVLQSKLDREGEKQQYVSPSDDILSPCTKKLASYKGRQFGKAHPKSLFAKQASKNLAAPGTVDSNDAKEEEAREEEEEGEKTL